MTSYAEKLKDPRWQKKRLKVLERDGFECTDCGDKEKTLHVHHLKYAKSGNPWDSPVKDLQTLCEDCHLYHKELKEQKKELIERIGELTSGEEIHAVMQLLGLIEAHWSETLILIEYLLRMSDRSFKMGMRATNGKD